MTHRYRLLFAAVFAVTFVLTACAPPGGAVFRTVFPAMRDDLRIDPLPVTLEDRSGLVTAIAAWDGPLPELMPDVQPVPGDANALFVRFTSGACDGTAEAVLQPGPDHLLLRVKTSLKPFTWGCVAVGISRVLRVTFATSMSADDVEVEQVYN